MMPYQPDRTRKRASSKERPPDVLLVAKSQPALTHPEAEAHTPPAGAVPGPLKPWALESNQNASVVELPAEESVFVPRTQYPFTVWNPASYGLLLPRSAVNASKRTLALSLAITAGLPSLEVNCTELSMNRTPSTRRRYQPYAGRVPMLFGL